MSALLKVIHKAEPISLADGRDNTTPTPQRRDADQDPTDYTGLLASEQMDLPALAGFSSEQDIDVPPELAEYDTAVFETPSVIPSSGGRIIEIDDLDPSEVARLFGSDGSPLAAASSASPILDRYQSHGSDSQPEAFELPTELFNSTVDVHARTWLRDFCAGG
ncbi:uncharacterized protein PV07_10733 [Cladophialophora immunda]|uniref:Uncharacterized protein n=1 Tax=Cladophialophora immunda TaxID=569365 RepID=A0A0D1ZBG9_9EURO|nr:uncharacterized protein PV07_10733 [Cladophialophora immunda]KIW25061.1 hypothetical protein PV07_10733 [Cladophialophora immunda]